MRISPTAEGFRTAFRQPLLTLAEISWRWAVGATATVLFFFGFFEYLNTLPVTNGELLFLKTRHPYLVAEAIAHILKGSLPRAVISFLAAGLLLTLLWIIAASLGRFATVQVLVEHFRNEDRGSGSRARISPIASLNFLRAAVALAAILGFVGAAILAGFASPDAHPRPGLAVFLFVPLAGLIALAWSSLNWLLSLAVMFAVRDGRGTVAAISSAGRFSRERPGPVFAVSTWTGLAHLVAFVGATTVVAIPLGFISLVPGRLVMAAMLVITLAYFALADWLYMARLAGYVCIAETPEALLAPLPPPPHPGPRPILSTIDRDELILSDVPNPAAG
jgi:hypothetical protein